MYKNDVREADIKRYYERQLRKCGIPHFRFSITPRGRVGIPDEQLYLPGKTIIIEFKKPKAGELRMSQVAIIAKLRSLGTQVYVLWSKEDVNTFMKDVIHPMLPATDWVGGKKDYIQKWDTNEFGIWELQDLARPGYGTQTIPAGCNTSATQTETVSLMGSDGIRKDRVHAARSSTQSPEESLRGKEDLGNSDSTGSRKHLAKRGKWNLMAKTK